MNGKVTVIQMNMWPPTMQSWNEIEADFGVSRDLHV